MSVSDQFGIIGGSCAFEFEISIPFPTIVRLP